MRPSCSRTLQARFRELPRWANAGRLVVYVTLLVAGGTYREAHGLPDAPSDTCSEIPGHVSFGALQVLPPKPAVGDEVELHFDTDITVHVVFSRFDRSLVWAMHAVRAPVLIPDSL